MDAYLSLFFSNPIVGMLAGMSIHIVKKYTLTVLVSIILTIYIYYRQKKLGKVIIISFLITLLTLITFKIYEDYNPDVRILKYPFLEILNNYVVFGLIFFLMTLNMDKIITKIRKSKWSSLLKIFPFIPK